MNDGLSGATELPEFVSETPMCLRGIGSIRQRDTEVLSRLDVIGMPPRQLAEGNPPLGMARLQLQCARKIVRAAGICFGPRVQGSEVEMCRRIPRIHCQRPFQRSACGGVIAGFKLRDTSCQHSPGATLVPRAPESRQKKLEQGFEHWLANDRVATADCEAYSREVMLTALPDNTIMQRVNFEPRQ